MYFRNTDSNSPCPWLFHLPKNLRSWIWFSSSQGKQWRYWLRMAFIQQSCAVPHCLHTAVLAATSCPLKECLNLPEADLTPPWPNLHKCRCRICFEGLTCSGWAQSSCQRSYSCEEHLLCLGLGDIPQLCPQSPAEKHRTRHTREGQRMEWSTDFLAITFAVLINIHWCKLINVHWCKWDGGKGVHFSKKRCHQTRAACSELAGCFLMALNCGEWIKFQSFWLWLGKSPWVPTFHH